jgi:hypothetical protein
LFLDVFQVIHVCLLLFFLNGCFHQIFQEIRLMGIIFLMFNFML